MTKSTCKRRSFSDENGNLIYTACGLRSCPLCCDLYASSVAQAVRLIHPDIVTHFVLTVDDEHISEFPQERDYALLKKIAKRRCQIAHKEPNIQDVAYIRDSSYISTMRQSHHKLLKVLHSRIRELLSIVARELSIQYEEIGWVRSVEFGEKNHRFHIHLGIFREPLVVITALLNAGFIINHDNDRDVYTFNNPVWPFGMVRITGLSGSKSVINYMTSYALKSSPGRITFDRKTSESRRLLKSFMKPVWRQRAGISQDAKFSYAPAGPKHAAQEYGKRERANKTKERKQNAYM